MDRVLSIAGQGGAVRSANRHQDPCRQQRADRRTEPGAHRTSAVWPEACVTLRRALDL